MATELERFYSAIESIDTAMMVTRRADGHLRARAMANPKRAGGADDGNREWISVSGLAIISRDRDKIRELYQPDWKFWFDGAGDPLYGTANDPRMVLIGVAVHAAEFLEVNKPKPVLLFEIVKGWLTGTEPELGEMHHLTEPRRT